MRGVAVGGLMLLVFGGCATEPEDRVEISHVHGLGVDPVNDEIYVATHFGLFVHGTDEWSQRSQDTDDHMGFTTVSNTLMFRSGHPATGGNLGVQRSTDGGRTWETVSPDTDRPWDFHAMTATREDPPMIIGWDAGGLGVFRSPDGAQTWEQAGAEGLPGLVGAFSATPDGKTIYASTETGLMRSLDRGDTWEPVGDESVFALAATDRGVLFASRDQDVIRSSDGGQTWEDTGLEGPSLIVALAAHPNAPIVAAADRDGVLWRSDDDGDTWTRIPPP